MQYNPQNTNTYPQGNNNQPPQNNNGNFNNTSNNNNNNYGQSNTARFTLDEGNNNMGYTFMDKNNQNNKKN